MFRRFAMSVCLLLLGSPLAWAQWVNVPNLKPGRSVVSGSLCYSDGENGLICDGTAAVPGGDRLVSGSSVVTLNSATGVVSLTTGGVTWGYVGSRQSYLPNVSATAIEANVVFNMPVGTVSNVTGPTGGSPVVPGAGGTGYFVLTNGTTNGNIGGLSGANTFCRNDLSANNWMGKPGNLDTSKIFAWLCDGTTCKNGLANTTYYYANAGDVTKGGAYFVTDSSGKGPNDDAQWDASNRFGAAYSYWTFSVTGSSSSTWSSSSNGTNCVGGTSTGGNGASGTTSSPGGQRWFYTYTFCGTAIRLICFVNP